MNRPRLQKTGHVFPSSHPSNSPECFRAQRHARQGSFRRPSRPARGFRRFRVNSFRRRPKLYNKATSQRLEPVESQPGIPGDDEQDMSRPEDDTDGESGLSVPPPSAFFPSLPTQSSMPAAPPARRRRLEHRPYPGAIEGQRTKVARALSRRCERVLYVFGDAGPRATQPP
jgi:hypothetical protein